MSLQEALKLLRLELGLTQQDLAKKLKKTFATVNRWENGKGFPTRSNAKEIIAIAKKSNASHDCISYLNEMLMPESKRTASAAVYGFADIDRDFLFELADGSNDAIYVIEEGTYKLLYLNRQAERFANVGLKPGEFKPNAFYNKQENLCYKHFGNRNSPCSICPLSKFDSNDYKDAILTLPGSERKLRIHAKATEINNRRVFAMYCTELTQEYDEREVLYDLTNDIPAGVAIYNVFSDGRIELEFMNTYFSETIGEITENASIQNGLSDFPSLYPGDRNRLLTEARKAIAEKRNISIDLRLKIYNKADQQPQNSERKNKEVHLSSKIVNKSKGKFTYYCLLREIGK